MCVKVDRAKTLSEKVRINFPGMPYPASTNLISFLAYGVADESLHIELYTLLQIREGKPHIRNHKDKNDGIEDWLQNSGGGKMPIRQTFERNGKKEQETIMTWIRNNSSC